jgi:hypothetical protein
MSYFILRKPRVRPLAKTPSLPLVEESCEFPHSFVEILVVGPQVGHCRFFHYYKNSSTRIYLKFGTTLKIFWG